MSAIPVTSRSRQGPSRRHRGDRSPVEGEALGGLLRRAFGLRQGDQPLLRGDIARCLSRLDTID